MSMLGLSFLSEIVNTVGDLHPATILNQLRTFIKYTLSQEGSESESKDGMDIALCVIDRESNQLEFAGAYNPVYIIRNGTLEEIKGDKMPVGIHPGEKDSFTNNIIPLDGITAFYLFSDGFADQFGGPEGRKFKAKNFRELLAKNYALTMDEQGEALEAAFNEWQGYYDQVDDVLVVGVRIV
ncbi:MAG TPA: SpoIIE family protein phosphatase, partial [Williamwhitmania sp.]|jgi:serine phosphatase RsbU (regulator of sigma subunit)|nr:SpoIIE family protein phosphatase [Williamwhitmania sp.]